MVLLALLVLALPGLPIAVMAPGDRDDPLWLLGLTAVAAASIWITGFWLLPYLGLGLDGLILGIGGAAALALVAQRARLRELLGGIEWSRAHLWALGIIALVAAVRLAPLAFAPVAPGADMSMHSYMARLIAMADGVPTTYRPLLPIDEFGAYPAGLPTLAALVARLSGADVARAAFVLTCLTHLWVTLAAYAWVRRHAEVWVAVAAALVVSVATRDPQLHFLWGGNPTVLSLVLVMYGLLLVESLFHERWRAALLPAALLLVGAALSHSPIPYALVFVLPPVLILRLARTESSARAALIGRGLALTAVCALLLLPYLAQLTLELTVAELDWIRGWQRLGAHVPPGPAALLPVTIFWHIGRRLGLVLLGWLVVALVLRRVRRPAPPIVEDLVLGAGVLLLVLNARVWVLPASYAIYPDRVMLLLILPAARIIGSALSTLRPRPWVLALVAASVVWPPVDAYLAGIGQVSVTGDDLAAIEWIAENTPADAPVANNYGDAGIWIPALAGRGVALPHANIVYMDEVRPWQQTIEPTVLMVGTKRVYEADNPWDRDALLAEPEVWEVLFRRGDAVVFRVPPGLHRRPADAFAREEDTP